MNYIRHLTGFFDRVANDDRLHPTHISLYIALFQFWNINRFQNPISIARSEMMKVSKIHANATYHKAMKDLHDLGFIQYKPSYNPYRGSEVVLLQFDDEQVHVVNQNHTKRGKRNEQAMNGHHAKIETSNEPMNEPYINNTNIINSKTAYEQSDEDTSSNFVGARAEEKKLVGHFDNEDGKGKPGGAPAGRNKSEGGPMSLPTSVKEVQAFFEEEKSTRLEAEKFFNYFQSNGWKVGGRSPMKDWRAAARNWMLNSQKFEPSKKPSALHTTVNKNYGEPL